MFDIKFFLCIYSRHIQENQVTKHKSVYIAKQIIQSKTDSNGYKIVIALEQTRRI